MNDLERQFDAYLDGVGGAEAELRKHIGADAEAMRLWIARSFLHAALKEHLHQSTAPLTVAVPTRVQPDRPRRLRIQPVVLVLAAVVAIAAAAVAIYVASAGSNAGPQSPGSPSPAIATLVWADAEVDGDEPLMTGDTLSAQTVRAQEGETEFALTSGATVKLSGSSEVRFASPLEIALTHGSAEITCPPAAAGFTAHLPGGLRVIDLGTRFQVSVNGEGATRVRVLEGRVEVVRVDARGADAERLLVAAGETVGTAGIGQPIVHETRLLADEFGVDTSSKYTMTQSHGTGGSFSISDGAMVVMPAVNNTVTVMRSDKPWLSVGARLLVDLPALTGAADQFLSISSGPEQPDVAEGRYGFRVRRESQNRGEVWVQSYSSNSRPGGVDHNSSKVTDGPITLIVERISATRFRCLYRRTSDRPEAAPVLIVDHEEPDLANVHSLYVGVQAWGNVEGAAVRFDNLAIDSIVAPGIEANRIGADIDSGVSP